MCTAPCCSGGVSLHNIQQRETLGPRSGPGHASVGSGRKQSDVLDLGFRAANVGSCRGILRCWFVIESCSWPYLQYWAQDDCTQILVLPPV